MEPKRKYIQVDISNSKPSYVTYTMEEGPNVPGAEPNPAEEGPKLMERASPAIVEAHKWLSGNYSHSTDRIAKANKHMLFLLNAIEDKLSENLSENPFKKIGSLEDVMKRQEEMSENVRNEAGILLGELYEEHREMPKLKPSLTSYLKIRQHVMDRMIAIISEHARKRKDELEGRG